MMSIEEAKVISKQKQDYKEWLDKSHSSVQSPNLNKVTRIIYLDALLIREIKQKTAKSTH